MRINHAGYESEDDCDTIQDALWSLARAIAGNDMDDRDLSLNTWAHLYKRLGNNITSSEIDWYIHWCDVSETYYKLSEKGPEDYPPNDYEAKLHYMERMIHQAGLDLYD